MSMMRTTAISITGRRRAAFMASIAVASMADASRVLVEVLGGGTVVDVSHNLGRVGSISRAMISPLEDSSGSAFADGAGGVLHIIS